MNSLLILFVGLFPCQVVLFAYPTICLSTIIASYSESLKSVERKYLEILKVWSLTEKQLTQIIYAREAELRIQDFYFDQVEKLRKTFDQTATLIGKWIIFF